MPEQISFLQLAIACIPLVIVLLILHFWQANAFTGIYATLRMLAQLFLVGFVLTQIFTTNQAWLVAVVIAAMSLIAAWIALRTVSEIRIQTYPYALVSVVLGGGLVLATIVLGVLQLEPWFLPRYVIPLAGMIFSSSMNAISLAADRYCTDRRSGIEKSDCRRKAIETALIPATNGMFAVGLVSIPGMMTGQVLSGVSPFIAARYQIMVMLMLFSATGLSAAIFLTFCQFAKVDRLLNKAIVDVKQGESSS